MNNNDALHRLTLAMKHPDTLILWRPFEYVRDDKLESFRPCGAIYRQPTDAARAIIFRMMGKS